MAHEEVRDPVDAAPNTSRDVAPSAGDAAAVVLPAATAGAAGGAAGASHVSAGRIRREQLRHLAGSVPFIVGMVLLLSWAVCYTYLAAGYWWETLFPALAIASLVMAINLIADSIEAVLIR
jgi:hypothetical protein